MHAPDLRAEQNADRKYADGRISRAEQAPSDTERSLESRRAEDAHRKVVCKQQTKADRLAIAAVLAEVLRRYAMSTDRLSIVVDIGEKQIRKMLAADVSIPAHMAKRMPTDMRRDYLAGYAKAIGCPPTTSPQPALDHIRRTRDVDAAHALEDDARALSRELGRSR